MSQPTRPGQVEFILAKLHEDLAACEGRIFTSSDTLAVLRWCQDYAEAYTAWQAHSPTRWRAVVLREQDAVLIDPQGREVASFEKWSDCLQAAYALNFQEGK